MQLQDTDCYDECVLRALPGIWISPKITDVPGKVMIHSKFEVFGLGECQVCNTYEDPESNVRQVIVVSDAPFVIVYGMKTKRVPALFESHISEYTDTNGKKTRVNIFTEKDFYRKTDREKKWSWVSLRQLEVFSELSAEEIFTNYGFLNNGGERGFFHCAETGSAELAPIEMKFYEFDWSARDPRKTWVPEGFARKVVDVRCIERQLRMSIPQRVIEMRECLDKVFPASKSLASA